MNLSFSSLKVFSQDIKLSHSVFSLPFVGATIILSQSSIALSTIFLLTLSLTCARSFAMGINRYFDRTIDSRNPRTVVRAIPSQKISAKASLKWTLLFGVFFILSSLAYGMTAFFCSFPVLAILALYPLTKKVTWLCHFYLGFCLALSPLALPVALNENFQLSHILIASAMLFWVCGFDIIYATQDLAFDKKENLFSIPSYFGIPKALLLSKICFALMILFLILLGNLLSLGFFYKTGLFIMSFILFYEHYSLSKMSSLDKINPIFFTANAWVSLIFFAFSCLESYFS